MRKSGTFWKLSPMLCSLMNRGLSLSISASMKHFQRVGIPFLLIFIAAATLAADQGSGKQAPSFVLPAQFGGWQLEGTVRTTKDPNIADPVSTRVLNEYGFGDFESATYSREDGNQLTLKTIRFRDASGAYGAFSFYKPPEMLDEKIGDRASSLNNRVLFYRGNVLVDAVFKKLTAMSAAELRELAGMLPLPLGNARNLPSLPNYLPRLSLVKNTAKYVVGPVAMDKLRSPLPSQLVDFNAGAEVVIGKYASSGGDATLMLISYPTPQIAAEHLRRIDAFHSPSTQQQAGAATLVDIGPFFDKRTGPIVVLAAGPLSQSEAKSLLASVNYDADVTWNQNTFFDKKNNIGNLVWNALVLSGILIAIGLVAGIAFGGVRVLIQRIIPERLLGREEQIEFISLGLDEGVQKPPAAR